MPTLTIVALAALALLAVVVAIKIAKWLFRLVLFGALAAAFYLFVLPRIQQLL